MKILSIVGARPQFIKLSQLSKTIRKDHKEIIVHTGQHFDTEMSKLFFEQLEIPNPDYNLCINGGNHGEQTGRMLIALEKVIYNEQPDLVIVFGDTNTTLAGSLAAAKMNIKTVHIEAGLRSFNKSMPEEINRIASDHLSDFLFAPTKTAMSNLENEGLANKSYITGDIMVDSLILNIEKAKKNSNILVDLQLSPNEYYLITLHRPYNVDEPENIELLFNNLSTINKLFVFPVHPRTKNIIEKNEIKIPKNLYLTKPVGYLDFILLEINAEKILTDSGGIQKEAYIIKKPCITIRPETEWLETIEEGWNVLVNLDDKNFHEKILSFNPSSKQKDVFGSSVAAKMADIINRILT